MNNQKTLFGMTLKVQITKTYQITNKLMERKKYKIKTKTQWRSKRAKRRNSSQRKNYSSNNSPGKLPNKPYNVMKQCLHSLFSSSMLVTKTLTKLLYQFHKTKTSRKKLSNKFHKTPLLIKSRNKQFIHSNKGKVRILLALTF